MKKRFPLLKAQDVETLTDALNYMKLPELKQALEQFELHTKGRKIDLIERIITYIETGEVTEIPQIPAESRAQKGVEYPLHPDTLMLYGSFKNDLKTREFFKQLIGKSFHYTAFGIDWLNQRWLMGEPPTYREFALFWKNEKALRKNRKAEPKKEWALLNFLQEYLAENPDRARVRGEFIAAWNRRRNEMVAVAQGILRKITL